MAEIVFILEPDTGRVTVESSNADLKIAKEISRDLGQGTVINCARPNVASFAQSFAEAEIQISQAKQVHLYRIYHHSTVDGPGRRSVIQFAGCSIRCSGCYVPETHERENGKLVSIAEIIAEIEKRSGEHDGVTILGGEPFDQTEGLRILVEKLKSREIHLTVYTGFTLESLLARNSESVNQILAKTDLLIDGGFDRTLAKNVGEYRGSSNQRLIYYPITRKK
jgi:anaerobic ribonucleoside-triphosphate reductase activating protein